MSCCANTYQCSLYKTRGDGCPYEACISFFYEHSSDSENRCAQNQHNDLRDKENTVLIMNDTEKSTNET